MRSKRDEKKVPDLIAFRQADPKEREKYRRAAEKKGVPLSAWIRSALSVAARRAA